MEVIQTEYKARVTNLSDKQYEENFNGRVVKFAPGETQIWDSSEAVLFKGQFIPVIKNEVGQYLTEKKIKVEKIIDTDAPRRVVGFQNPQTGKIFPTAEEMRADMVKNSGIPVKEDTSALQAVIEAQSNQIKQLTQTVENLLANTAPTKKGKKVKNDTAGADRRGEEHL